MALSGLRDLVQGVCGVFPAKELPRLEGRILLDREMDPEQTLVEGSGYTQGFLVLADLVRITNASMTKVQTHQMAVAMQPHCKTTLWMHCRPGFNPGLELPSGYG